jgi:hypothetical protein
VSDESSTIQIADVHGETLGQGQGEVECFGRMLVTRVTTTSVVRGNLWETTGARLRVDFISSLARTPAAAMAGGGARPLAHVTAGGCDMWVDAPSADLMQCDCSLFK